MSRAADATDAGPAGLEERLRAFVGRPAGPPSEAPEPVNESMIRHWCEALDDRNPAYADPAFARGSAHGGLVAPPTMLQVWTMRGLRPAPREGDALGELLRLLDEAGFTSIVATNCEQEYLRYLRPGDVLTATTVISAVTGEKRTSLGPGHFLTTSTVYRDASGAVVGRMMQRYLKFRPAGGEGRGRPRPAVNQDTAFFWEGAARGELLVQRCASCGELRHPPRPMCGGCGSLAWDVVRASGRGEVYSYVVVHHPPVPGFQMPYVVALIALEEGTRIVSNVVGVPPGEVRIGMPVEVEFLRAGEVTLPVFRPRG